MYYKSKSCLFIYFRKNYVGKWSGTLDIKIKYSCDPILQLTQSTKLGSQQPTENTELEVKNKNLVKNILILIILYFVEHNLLNIGDV